MFQIDKPLPAVTEDGAPYWEAAKHGRLVCQRCTACGHLRFPPSILCPRCLSEDTEWTALSGRGTVYSFIVVHRPQYPAFFADVPYNVAIVELEEGIRLHTNVVECAPEALRIDLPVEVVFDKVHDEATLPKFRPRAATRPPKDAAASRAGARG
ncbi:MAG: Zn-ribbon domain-containing OB-fold protein [Candidatus Binatia bacterium]